MMLSDDGFFYFQLSKTETKARIDLLVAKLVELEEALHNGVESARLDEIVELEDEGLLVDAELDHQLVGRPLEARDMLALNTLVVDKKFILEEIDHDADILNLKRVRLGRNRAVCCVEKGPVTTLVLVLE